MAMAEAMLASGAKSALVQSMPHEKGDQDQQPEVRSFERLSVDQVLEKYVGDFGPAQWLHFSLASLAWATEALHTLVTIFADQKPRTICLADGSTDSAASFSSTACSISSICSLNRSEWTWIAGASSSTVSEFDLVCGDEFKIGLVQSLFFAGALVGAGIFGHLADSVAGRKGGLRLACVASGVLGIATAYSPNFWVYAVLRTATGMASVGGIGLCSFVLATEPVGTSKRGAVGMSTLYFFSMGTMLLILIAKLCSASWRMLYIVTSIPTLLYSILLLPLLCESPRWLLVRGKKSKAMEVLRKFARRNGKAIPENVVLVTEIEADDAESANAGAEELCKSGTIADLFRHSTLRVRLIVMIIIWFAASVVYYGVSLNVSNTGFDLYISVLLNALVEIPAFVITAVLLGRIGRRKMLVSSMAVSGIFCAVGSIAFATLAPSHRSVAGLICGALGIFGVAAAYNLVFIYTSELFPTVVRNVALGVASQAAQIGAIAAPLTVQLATFNPSLPFAIFALAGVLGALLAAVLPETLNQDLYETLEGITKPLLS